MGIYKFQRPLPAKERIGAVKGSGKDVSYPGDSDKHEKFVTGDDNIDSTTVIEEPPRYGFAAIDAALKDYFSNIVIPTKDGTKTVEVRISGGQKGFLFFQQQLARGRNRVKLPILNLNRTSMTFNPNKYSPPHFYAHKQIIDRDKFMGRKFFRNWPFLINYSCGIWSATKADAELIIQEIFPRFDPLASIPIETNDTVGTLQAKLGGCNDNTTVEAGPEDPVKVNYEFALECEGWLQIKTIKAPLIRGIVSTQEISD